MQDNTLDLTQLRDIHLGSAPNLWPLALGWWVIMTIVLIVLFLFFYYRYQKNKPKKTALYLVSQLHDRYKENNTAIILPQLSCLLRQIALSRFDRNSIAHLQGQEWLRFLDHTGKTTEFTMGVGKIIATAPYQLQPIIDDPRIFDCIKQWVRTIYDKS